MKVKRYLKHFKFNVGTVEEAIYECLDGVGNSNKRWNRMDTAYFLADYLIILDKSEGLQRYELAHNLNNFIIDRILRGVAQSQTDDSVLFAINQIPNPSLTCSSESTDAVDALGTPVATFYRSKTHY